MFTRRLLPGAWVVSPSSPTLVIQGVEISRETLKWVVQLYVTRPRGRVGSDLETAFMFTYIKALVFESFSFGSDFTQQKINNKEH